MKILRTIYSCGDVLFSSSIVGYDIVCEVYFLVKYISCEYANTRAYYAFNDFSRSPQSIYDGRNSPRIAAFVGEESIQYFILVEKTVLCQVPSLQLAILFLAFSAYYTFHLEYPKSIMYFLQDYVLSYPDALRRPATYLAMASDIKKLVNDH